MDLWKAINGILSLLFLGKGIYEATAKDDYSKGTYYLAFGIWCLLLFKL
jgi:hypothetical protein